MSTFAFTDMSLEKKARTDNKKVDNWSYLPARLLVAVLGYLEWYEDAADSFCVCKSWSAVPDHLKERLQKTLNSTIGFAIAQVGIPMPGLTTRLVSILFPEWKDTPTGFPNKPWEPVGRRPFYIGSTFLHKSKSKEYPMQFLLGGGSAAVHDSFVDKMPAYSVWKRSSHQCKVPAFLRLALVTRMLEQRWKLDEAILVAQRKCSDMTRDSLFIVDVSSGLDPATGKITEECFKMPITI